MPTKTSALAIVPDTVAWSAIQAIRRVHDSRQFPVWPPHINLIYPFVAERDYPDVAKRLAEATASLEPVKIRFSRFAHFGGRVAYLVPDCEADPGLARLYDACLSVLPECRALQHREFTPHLTVGQFRSAQECQAFMKTCAPVDLEIEISCISMLARDTMNHPFRTPLKIRMGAAYQGVELGTTEAYDPDVVPKNTTCPSSLAGLLSQARPVIEVADSSLASSPRDVDVEKENVNRRDAEDQLGGTEFPMLEHSCNSTSASRAGRGKTACNVGSCVSSAWDRDKEKDNATCNDVAEEQLPGTEEFPPLLHSCNSTSTRRGNRAPNKNARMRRA